MAESGRRCPVPHRTKVHRGKTRNQELYAGSEGRTIRNTLRTDIVTSCRRAADSGALVQEIVDVLPV